VRDEYTVQCSDRSRLFSNCFIPIALHVVDFAKEIIGQAT
jgi:hypothetical protein